MDDMTAEEVFDVIKDCFYGPRIASTYRKVKAFNKIKEWYNGCQDRDDETHSVQARE